MKNERRRGRGEKKNHMHDGNAILQHAMAKEKKNKNEMKAR
jgi:hypothetical protein